MFVVTVIRACYDKASIQFSRNDNVQHTDYRLLCYQNGLVVMMNTWWTDGRLNFRAVETMDRIPSCSPQTLYDLSVLQNMKALNTSFQIACLFWFVALVKWNTIRNSWNINLSAFTSQLYDLQHLPQEENNVGHKAYDWQNNEQIGMTYFTCLSHTQDNSWIANFRKKLPSIILVITKSRIRENVQDFKYFDTNKEHSRSQPSATF
jgi:hypothetical protein